MSKVSKISLHIFAILQKSKHGGDEVDFLPADKHKSFLQVDIVSPWASMKCEVCSVKT